MRSSCVGCVLLASALLTGQGTARDDAAALRIVDDACRDGGAESCTLAGWAHEHERGRGIAANGPRASELYTLGCKRGSGRGCAEAARVAERRDPRDARIFELFDRSCNALWYLPACAELGRPIAQPATSPSARRSPVQPRRRRDRAAARSAERWQQRAIQGTRA